MTDLREVSVNVGRTVIGQPANAASRPDWHAYVVRPEVAGACVYQRNQTTVDLGAHGLNYGTGIITGIGCFEQTEPTGADNEFTHAIFRANDHAGRFVANLLAMGFQPPIGGAITPGIGLVEALVIAGGLGIPQLTEAKDVYVRALGFGENSALGVGSPCNGEVVVFTRDMTQYVDPAGIDLLWPGELLRRASVSSGMPFIKAAPNYTLAGWWKRFIAPQFGCSEVLCLSDDGSEVAETSGSIPLLIFWRDTQPTLVVPRFEAGRLNSITLDTVIALAKHLGWHVVTDRLVNAELMQDADELWLCGTWSGLVPVNRVWYDQRYLLTYGLRPNAEWPVRIPLEVFEHGVGLRYRQWVTDNFVASPHDSADRRSKWQLRGSRPHGNLLRDLYWAVVRNDHANLRGFEVPNEWHTPVEPLLPGNS